MITQKVYDLILEEYGSRRCWISDLAAKLGICYANANYLTYGKEADMLSFYRIPKLLF